MISKYFKGKLIFSFPIFFVFFNLAVQAQNSEVGFGVGGFYYTGDLSPSINITQVSPGVIGYFRSNFTEASSLRVGINAGKLKGSDGPNYKDSFSKMRDASFDLFLMEASFMYEYNFLDFKNNPRQRFSPYFTGGLAIFNMSGQQEKAAQFSSVQLAIPLGVGVKYVLNPKWYVGAEFVARKTFFDYLDNVSEGNTNIKNYQYGNPNDNDSYYFFGITLNYTFYTIPCPFPYN